MHSTFERRLGTGRKAVAFGFFVVLALTFLAFAGSARAGIESAPPPQIWSDKADYAPGETVVLSGANWAPGDSVHIRVNDDAGQTWSRDVDVIADASGAISDQFNLPDWFVAVYTVTATAASGTATTSFTDGNVAIRHASTVQSGLAADYKLERYDGASCAGAVKASNPFSIPGGGSKSIASGGSESVKVTLVGVISGNYTLDHWNFVDGNDGSDGSPYQVGAVTVTATSFCFATQNNTNRTFIPIFKAINSAPTANAQSVSTNEDTAKAITLAGSDADGNVLTFSIVSGPSHGTLGALGTVTCTGTVPKSCIAEVTYTPALNYNGPDSFTFKVNDGTVDSANATVSITVNAVNDAPTCTNGSATTTEDTPKAITLSCADVEGNSLTYSIVAGPTHGLLSGSGASRTYTPDANYNGSDSFTFKANDGSDSNVATFSLTVDPVNDAPVATAQSVSTNEDTAKAITLAGTDVDGDALTFKVTTLPANGKLYAGTVATGHLIASGELPYSLGAGNSLVTYDPNLNFNGSNSFKFVARDASVDSAEATVSIVVTPVNDAPTCSDGSETTDEDTPVDITLNCADVDGDSLTYSIVAGPTHGSLSGSGASRTYTPDANFNGADSFTFSANDGTVDSDVATFDLTVTAVNDAPTCSDGSETTDEDTPVDITLNCADVDGDSLTYSIVAGPTHGLLSGSGASRTYTPDANFNGADSFTFSANDGTVDSDVATFDLTVTAVDDPPAVTSDEASVTVDEGDAAANSGTYGDVDGDTVTLSASVGTVTDNGDGTWDWSFGASDGPDESQTVTITASDGTSGDEAEATFDLTVTNVAPTATFSNNGPVDEGSSFLLSMDDGDDVSSVDKAAKFTFAFDCGDGSGYGSFAVTATLSASQSCSTDDNGSREVKAKIRDKDGGVREYTATVTVANVAPSASFNAPTEVDEGSDIDVSLSDVVDPGTADTHEYRFKCGDGDWTAYGASASHSCPTTDNGTVVVKGQVRDDDGGESEVYSADVTVANVAPSASFNAPTEVDEGSDIDVSLSDVVDPGTADTHEYRFKCGDGDWTAYGASASHSCPTTDNGTVVVKGQVRDDDGGESEVYSADVTVNNVAPTATFSNDGPVDEGSDIDVSLSDVVDPGTADTHEYRFKCGDGDWTAYGASASHSCPTTDNGTVVVKGQVRDDDGGESEVYSADVTVANVAPSASFNAPTEVDEGSDIDVSLSDVVDPGTADTHEYRFKCGDGDWTAYGASASHSCPTTDNGTVVVKGQVRDDDGGESEVYSADVTVNNVAPTATFSNDGPVDEGSSFLLSMDEGDDVSSVDKAAKFTFAFDCGDGSGYGSFTVTPTLSASQSCPTDDNGSRSVKAKIRDKDGGVHEYTGTATVTNVAPTATFSNNGPVDEGSPVTVSFADQSDPSSVDTAAGFHYAYACDNSSLSSATYAGSGTSASKSCTFGDNGSKTVRARIIDQNGGYTEYETTVTVRNVAPTRSNASFTFDPLFGTATAGFDFSDVGWLDTHGPSLSFFTWSDVGNRYASVTEENIAPNSTGHASDTRTLNPGCYNLTVTGTARDDDGGTSASLAIYSNSATSVYGRGFRPPIMDSERNIAKYGNVVPVKVVLTNTCTGATVTNVPLFITLAKGVGDEAIEDVNLIAESVSAADTGSQMRTVDGMYIFNLSTKSLAQNTDYTIRIRPNSTTAPYILQAVLYPKK